jgi:glycine oxidase
VHLAALASGVEFRTGKSAIRVVTRARGQQPPRACGIELDDGTTLEADITVVAAGSWTTLLGGLPLDRGAVVPARGQLVELDRGAPYLHRVAFGAGVYLIPRADGRLLVGSTLEFVGYQKGVTTAGLHHLLGGALRIVPELADAEVTRSWSNFRPYTRDHLPLIGRVGMEGLIVASGHYRNGILLAPITARIVTALVLGQRAPIGLGPFDPERGTGR